MSLKDLWQVLQSSLKDLYNRLRWQVHQYSPQFNLHNAGSRHQVLKYEFFNFVCFTNTIN